MICDQFKSHLNSFLSNESGLLWPFSLLFPKENLKLHVTQAVFGQNAEQDMECKTDKLIITYIVIFIIYVYAYAYTIMCLHYTFAETDGIRDWGESSRKKRV